MSRLARNWVVVIHDIGSGDSEPTTYGPFTRRRAEEVAAAFNRTHESLGWWAGAGTIEAPTITALRARYEDNSITETRGDLPEDAA